MRSMLATKPRLILLGCVLLGALFFFLAPSDTVTMEEEPPISEPEIKEDIAEDEQKESITRITLREIPQVKREEKKEEREDRPVEIEKAVPVESVTPDDVPKEPSARPIPPEHKGQTVGKQREGAFPTISVNYRRHLGLNRYIKEMVRVGGRFFIINMRTKTIKAEIDFASESLKEATNLGSLSPRARRITSEAKLDTILTQARKAYGHGSYAVILLFPNSIERALAEDIEAALKKSNMQVAEFSRFDAEYRMTGGRLCLVVLSGITDKGETPLSFEIWL